MAQGRFGDTRKYFNKQHISVHNVVHLQRALGVGAEQRIFVELYVEPYLGQRRIVVALERVKIVGTHLRRAVAAPQVVLKKYCHFLHHRFAVDVGCRSNLQGGDEILLTIGANLANGQLAAGDDYRLLQILKHKTQCRSSVSHGVGAVKHHKTVVIVDVLFDGLSNVAPMLRAHVCTIDRRLELNVSDFIVEHLNLWYVIYKMREIERLQTLGQRVFNHTYCSTRIYNQYLRFAVHSASI